jgi:hypothetical protein
MLRHFVLVNDLSNTQSYLILAALSTLLDGRHNRIEGVVQVRKRRLLYPRLIVHTKTERVITYIAFNKRHKRFVQPFLHARTYFCFAFEFALTYACAYLFVSSNWI